MTKHQLSLFDEPKTIADDAPKPKQTQLDMFSQRDVDSLVQHQIHVK